MVTINFTKINNGIKQHFNSTSGVTKFHVCVKHTHLLRLNNMKYDFTLHIAELRKIHFFKYDIKYQVKYIDRDFVQPDCAYYIVL